VACESTQVKHIYYNPGIGDSRVRVAGKYLACGGERLQVRGVTYGPFAPNAGGEHFAAPDVTRADFQRMREIGINSIRTYHVPPIWLLDLAAEEGLRVFIDVPWPKHVCFLDNRDVQRSTRQTIRDAVRGVDRHPAVLAYSIGNEIPADIIRWHGAARVERFLRDLMDTARQVDPEGLVTYANYPSTEYLDLSFLDFATFNVYLHSREVFRRYLLRLQNLVGDKPLLLGEIGMDSYSHCEEQQAGFLAGHLIEAGLNGLAGAFVFSWTDDWFSGGHQIENWAFGITRADRSPKAAFFAVQDAMEQASLPESDAPRVSVVVCSYNGAATLEQCLRSLEALDYPDYEVILVDDGSTDDTAAIAGRFPSVRYIQQPNLGLSAARNTGLAAATGSIIAYTDSDCFPEPDWLSKLVHQLQCTNAAAVGGPNLSPDDGWLAACIGASPGQPIHVLESDQIAEHVPGCNMAFHREALEAINGFNATYRKAGDDVDVCWRLQQAGMWITFAPGACVWHHRRQSPRSYLRQQAGYGEAEALLWFEHPDKFNIWGESKWHGALRGEAARGIRLGKPVIYHGTFGAGLFQTLYQPGFAHWAMLPSTLEWHIAAAVTAMTGFLWTPAWAVTAAMLGLAAAVALLQARQAKLPARYAGPAARLLVTLLCYLQPLVRGGWRYRTRLFPPNVPQHAPRPLTKSSPRLPGRGRLALQYWNEAGQGRTELLNQVVDYLANHHWAMTIDAGWEHWDLKLYCHPWTVLEMSTAQEDHGGDRRLIRIRYRQKPSGYSLAIAALASFAACVAITFSALSPAVTALLLAIFLLSVWQRGTTLSSEAIGIVDDLAGGTELSRCSASPVPDLLGAPQPTAITEADMELALPEIHGGRAVSTAGREASPHPGSEATISSSHRPLQVNAPARSSATPERAAATRQ
jgi:GT2 family glycosyltransferase